MKIFPNRGWLRRTLIPSGKARGAIPVADSPAEYAAFLRKDYERWAGVIKVSGVKAE